MEYQSQPTIGNQPDLTDKKAKTATYVDSLRKQVTSMIDSALV